MFVSLLHEIVLISYMINVYEVKAKHSTQECIMS